MISKRKGRYEGNVHFLSNLPLTECIARLQRLESKKFAITFSDETDDTITFKAYLLERGVIRAEANGSLRRWEGTLTRVDCDVKIRERILRWLMLLAVLSLLMMVAVPILFFLAAGIPIMVWMAISIGFLCLILGTLFALHRYTPLDDTPQNLLYIITSILDE